LNLARSLTLNRRRTLNPIPGTDRVDILALDVIRAARITMQQSLQLLEIEMRCQQIWEPVPGRSENLRVV